MEPHKVRFSSASLSGFQHIRCQTKTDISHGKCGKWNLLYYGTRCNNATFWAASLVFCSCDGLWVTSGADPWLCLKNRGSGLDSTAVYRSVMSSLQELVGAGSFWLASCSVFAFHSLTALLAVVLAFRDFRCTLQSEDWKLLQAFVEVWIKKKKAVTFISDVPNWFPVQVNQFRSTNYQPIINQ